ncbi:MAG: CoA pyrophosphatase [Bradymonadaceae bacterium]
MTDGPFDTGRIRRRLEGLARDPIEQWHDRGDFEHVDLESAAVLIPITERDGEFYLVFTHRSDDLEKHSGEVSFPGGRPEPEDNTLVETALRESHEEIALLPGDVEVFGALTELPTVTGFEIVSYVGEFPSPYELVPSPREIETLFQAPLSELADPANHRLEEREFGGQTYPVHYFEYDGHVIWGATGFLLDSLLRYLDLKA